MIFNMNGSTGKDVLNFKIIGGTSQPTETGENLIWINTDAEIIGYNFSATEPAQPAEGMVWIATGSASDAAFNALKENTLMVYPLSAKQYINGAWVDKDMQIYNGNTWVELSAQRYLYNAGDLCEAFTGGWKHTSGENMVITYNAANISWRPADSSSNASACLYTNSLIDVTNYTKLCAEAYAGNDASGALGLTNDNTESRYGNFVTKADLPSEGDHTLTVDISEISGSYYVCFMVVNGGALYKVWLE